MALEFTDSNFSNYLLEGSIVVADFWAEWCGPCRMVGPFIEELYKEYDGKVSVGKVNVDLNPELASRYGIRSIPTVLFFKDGQIVDRQIGAVPKNVLDQKIQALLG